MSVIVKIGFAGGSGASRWMSMIEIAAWGI
jgi:hypothetical protein